MLIPPRAQIVYPNFTSEPAGARINFWNYDPTEKGWYIYGQGTVTGDRKQIVPDPCVVIYEFSGIMISTTNRSDGPPCDCGAWDGDPVNLATGLFVLNSTDLVLPDSLPLSITRTYHPGDTASYSFGKGSVSGFDLVRFYNKGGEANPHLDPEISPLNLSDKEMNDLVEFMRALTSDDVLKLAQTTKPQTRKRVPLPQARSR